MVKLPDAQDLDTRLPRGAMSGLEPGTNPIPGAMQRLGSVAAELGSVLQARQRRDEADTDQQREFALTSNMLDLEAAQRERVRTASEKERDAATGFTQRMQPGYDTEARKFFATVPDSKKPEYDLKLKKLWLDIRGDADAFETKARYADAGRRIETGLTNLLVRQEKDPAAGPQVLEEGYRLIDAAPIPEQSKYEIKEQWKLKRVKTDMLQHPDEARKLLLPQRGAATGGGNLVPGLGESIDRAAARHGVSGSYLKRLAQIESSGGRNLSTPLSSASGPFAFTKGTARQYGLKDTMDFDQSADAAARLARDNAVPLAKALGRPPTDGELYLAHQQGIGGALALLNDPNDLAVSILGYKAVMNNGGGSGMTAKQFADKWINKFEKGGGGGGGGPSGPTFMVGQPGGLVKPGNIDLNTRPQVQNDDGSISTVRSMSFEEDGREILIPTISDSGETLSEADAIAQYQTTGKHLGIFDSVETANTYAEKLHEQQAQQVADAGADAPWPDRYADIPPEDRPAIRASLQADYNKEVAAQEAAQKKAAEAYKDDVAMAIEGDEFNGVQQIAQDPNLAEHYKPALIRRFRERQKELLKARAPGIAADNLREKIRTNAYINPAEPGTKKAANTVFAQNGGGQTLVAGDDRATKSVQVMWNMAGLAPPDAIKAFGAMLHSPNDKTVVTGLKILEQMQQKNPAAFSEQFGKAIEKDVHLYQEKLAFYDAPKIAEIMRERHDPEWLKGREKVRQKALVDATKEYDAAKVAGLYAGGEDDTRASYDFMTGAPGPPAVAGDSEAMAEDFRELYAQSFAETGDAEFAEKDAHRLLRKKWRPSSLNGGRITAYAPETMPGFFPPIDGSHQYLKDLLETDLKNAGYTQEVEVVASPRNFNPNQPRNVVRPYSLRAVPYTQSLIKAGQMPQYNVVITAPDGGTDLVKDTDGTVMMWPGKLDVAGYVKTRRAKRLDAGRHRRDREERIGRQMLEQERQRAQQPVDVPNLWLQPLSETVE